MGTGPPRRDRRDPGAARSAGAAATL